MPAPIVRQRRKKIYKYDLSRVKLEEPIVRGVPSGGYVITHKTVLKSSRVLRGPS